MNQALGLQERSKKRQQGREGRGVKTLPWQSAEGQGGVGSGHVDIAGHKAGKLQATGVGVKNTHATSIDSSTL
jgi:hypothetical protein